MSDFLGAKHQSSTNTSKFQWTNICLFKELFKFSFLLLCGYNNSSKSNFKFLSSPEGFQKDVFIIINYYWSLHFQDLSSLSKD